MQGLFTSHDVFAVFEQAFLASLKKNQCDAHVYLFMPDHVHMLLEGSTEEAGLWQCIVDFKQSTGYWLSQSGRTERWQHDFYDHILRKDEDVEKQVRYILNNPVRAGIVQDWMEYPFKGSTLYDFETW